MINSFRCKKTGKLFEDGACDKQFKSFQAAAERALRKLEAATVLDDLKNPPGNHFEALAGNRAGQFSIRINKKWRLCFTWGINGPDNVEIVDYH